MNSKRYNNESYVKCIKSEKFILQNSKHQYITNLEFAFKNRNDVIFVMKYYGGGNLKQNIENHDGKRFNEKAARFYAG